MLEGLEPPKQKYTCKVETLSSELEKKDVEILLAAIADSRKWSAKGLQTALKARGVIIADTVITKHRQKLCRCYQD